MSNRRDFLKKAGGLALLTIVPRSVLGGTKFVAPSDQLTKGIIGVGGIGKSSYHFTSNDACRLVAVCDVDRKHLESAIALGRKKFDKTLESYHDYRDLITDPNVDIVHIATTAAVPDIHRNKRFRPRARRSNPFFLRSTNTLHIPSTSSSCCVKSSLATAPTFSLTRVKAESVQTCSHSSLPGSTSPSNKARNQIGRASCRERV